jgi:hypothetical protein
MACTRRTTRKSIGRLPVGQRAPQNVPLEEEPCEIELVAPESPTAQGSSAEEQ